MLVRAVFATSTRVARLTGFVLLWSIWSPLIAAESLIRREVLEAQHRRGNADIGISLTALEPLNVHEEPEPRADASAGELGTQDVFDGAGADSLLEAADEDEHAEAHVAGSDDRRRQCADRRRRRNCTCTYTEQDRRRAAQYCTDKPGAPCVQTTSVSDGICSATEEPNQHCNRRRELDFGPQSAGGICN